MPNRLRNFQVSVLLVFLLPFCGCQPGNNQSQSSTYDVRELGATGEKSQYAQPYIQKAIDKAHNNGGGTVYFPPGDYLTGFLEMKSNVTLHIEAGATIWASKNEKHYKTSHKIYKKHEPGEEPDASTPVLIYARDAKNITITGKGTIHGQAERTYDSLKQVDGFIRAETENAREAGVEMKMYYKVPPVVTMFFLESCSNITIRDVSLEESVDWTLHFKWSDRIFIDNIYIASSLEAGVNADGIDIDGCHDVVISNCIIETGDDAIVLKSTRTGEKYRSCENITVTNSSLVSTSSALKLGTESFGDFRHIVFNNCVIRNTNRGMGIIVRDGGTVSDVLFSNITVDCDRKHFNWWGDGDPIWLVVKKRNANSKIGKIQNVSFQNIRAIGQGTSKIEGFPGQKRIEDIRFSDVVLTMEAEDKPDKRASHILAVNDVAGLYISDLTARWDTSKGAEPKWQNAIHLNMVDNFQLNNIVGSSSPGEEGAAVVKADNVSNGILSHITAMSATSTVVELTGANTRNLVLEGIDLLNHANSNVNVHNSVSESNIKYNDEER